MYLEISPRRTGKTTRFVKAVKEWIKDENNVALIFCHQRSWARELGRQIGARNRNSVQFIFGEKQFNDYLIGCCRSERQRVFVDEFDFMDWYPVDVEGYYVTTPKRQRTMGEMISFLLGENEDRFLQLIRFNNGHYEQYSPMQWLNQMNLSQIKDLRHMYQREHFNMEMLANAFK